MDDDYEWQPPTEAEMKIIQARSERSDKISKLMGDYMLKGYKMLGICCPECSTILLQNKQGVNYCVACKELDTDTDKDDPVLSQDAARSQLLEDSVADAEDTSDLSFMPRLEPAAPVASQGTSQVVTSSVMSSMNAMSRATVANQPMAVNATVNLTQTFEAVHQKMLWATDELKKASSVEYCIQLTQLIKSSAEAMQGLHLLSSPASSTT